jgi:hypothetical protein
MPSETVNPLTRKAVSIAPDGIIQFVLRKQARDKRIIQERDASPIPFPMHIVGGFAGRFAYEYSQVLEPRIPAFYMSALVCLGSVLSGSIRINSELTTDPRLYVVFIGQSGEAKKSTAAKMTLKFFNENVREFRSCEGAGSAEGLFQEINGQKWNRRMVLFYDEFQQFVNKCRIESSVLLQMVNILFENNKYESPLKKSKMKLDNTYLSLLSASTEETYEDCWTASFTNIGFNNRLFIVPTSSHRMHSIPGRIEKNITTSLVEELNAILGMVGEGIEYNVTREAFQIYDRWYKGLKSGAHSVRIDTYALRLMPLLAVNEMKTIIDEDIVRKAITLCEWQLRVRRRYEPAVTENQYATIEARIRKVLLEHPMSTRELQRKTNSNRVGIRIFMNALDNMQTIGEVYKGQEGLYHIREEQHE